MALAAMGCGGGGVACDPCGFGTKCYYEKMKRKGGGTRPKWPQLEGC